MQWINLYDVHQLNRLDAESEQSPVLIFKHSPRCSVSTTILKKLENEWQSAQTKHVQIYLLDIILYKELSNLISTQYVVSHESPQVLIVQYKKVIYTQSHFQICYKSMSCILEIKT